VAIRHSLGSPQVEVFVLEVFPIAENHPGVRVAPFYSVVLRGVRKARGQLQANQTIRGRCGSLHVYNMNRGKVRLALLGIAERSGRHQLALPRAHQRSGRSFFPTRLGKI
jgi:hypothetical protein